MQKKPAPVAARKRTKQAAKSPKVAKSAKPRSKPAKVPVSAQPSTNGWFPIVGIGASAGGLETLIKFFKAMPHDSGMAFVVVQHLDPSRKGMMAELLQRGTSMPITQVKDLTPIEPDHIYVIPPNKDLSLLHGVLHLLTPVEPRGLRLPIDFFFRSLAADQGERSIGVILSGMGTDGTRGLQAIKDKRGGTFVQDPASAKFNGMPFSAADAGLADVIAPVEELPERILNFRQNPVVKATADMPLQDRDQSALDKVLILLRAQTGHDFSLYKKSTLYRRVERRMVLNRISTIGKYVAHLNGNSEEIAALFAEFLIGVTSFFRDPDAWNHLASSVLPSLFAHHATDGQLRAWVAGCSTGEEAYSLAIIFKEAVERLKPARNLTLQIFATDIDATAIDKARQGLFPPSVAKDVSAQRLRRFFVEEPGGYRAGKEIREMVIFAPQTVIMDPPFTRLDLVCCRNLLIYFSAELQKALIPLFHYSLNERGILFLGSSETVGTFTNLFSALNDKARIYERTAQPLRPEPLDFPASFLPGRPVPPMAVRSQGRTPVAPPSLQMLTTQLLLNQHCPTAVLTTDKGNILYINGRSGKYLEPATGAANWNIFAMARPGLRHELDLAFAKVLGPKRLMTLSGLKIGTNGGTQVADVTVQRLAEPEQLRGLILVVIADVAPLAKASPAASKRRISGSGELSELRRQLILAREEIASMREARQTSQEEHRSANEELQSANEELQSANEEMTTSREEMQSLNEELHTVNRELQARVDDLAQSNSDMSNLLNSTDIATLFLDSELRVRRFTPRAAKIIKFVPSDVGRPFTDLATDLDYPRVADDAREVMQTLIPIDKSVAGRDGKWFAVRLMPYRTVENKIDGLVITFTDVSALKAIESVFATKEAQFKQALQFLPLLMWRCEADGSCCQASQQWLDYAGCSESDLLGQGWQQRIHPEDRERTVAAWSAGIASGLAFAVEFRLFNSRGQYRWHKSCATAVRDAHASLPQWECYAQDIDELRRTEVAVRQLSESAATGQ